MYIKAITLKNDASREMNNFQRDLFFKRAFLKMETLNFISYIVENSVCDHLPPCLKKNPKKGVPKYFTKFRGKHLCQIFF